MLDIDLCGDWGMAYSLDESVARITSSQDVTDAGLDILRSRVPGNLELDLQANGIIEEPFFGMNVVELTKYEWAHCYYFRNFEAGTSPGYDAELVFEGLDCYADVYLNGELVGSTDNMLVEHVFSIGHLLKGRNELLVHIKPTCREIKKYDCPVGVFAMPTDFDGLFARKAPHMFGWDIMPRAVSAGIWRPVMLRYRPEERIETVFVETVSMAVEPSSATLCLNYRLKTAGCPADDYEIRVQGKCGASTFAKTAPVISDAGFLRIEVDQARFWWPLGRGEADLYDASVFLLKNGELIDTRKLTFGIRKVQLDRTSITDADGNGEFCLRVNGEKVFCKGSNWVPADAYHSRDVERIPRMLDLAEEVGCNILRCWGGNVYENDLFYDICDRKGIMVWQDFAMACAVYPQDAEFCGRIEIEARKVIGRLRQHPCIVLWSGDNECDQAYGWAGRGLDPNTNVLTRNVLPMVVNQEDGTRPYLPSSPYIDHEALKAGEQYLSENHLWGPRDYHKSAFYLNSLCHFASEIGYHGCPSPESIERFISPDKLWPYRNNEEWNLHSTAPVPGVELSGPPGYRVELMANQIRALFGDVPDNLVDFAYASQACQAEAKKFFIELFRGAKWRRTGIIWWNLIDGWPQFSDAVVDYYFRKKLAYHFIKRSQAPLLLMLREPEASGQDLVACNDTRESIETDYSVRDVGSGEVVAEGRGIAAADCVTRLARISYSEDRKRFYVIKWTDGNTRGTNHYLAGKPPFELRQYREWLKTAGLQCQCESRKQGPPQE